MGLGQNPETLCYMSVQEFYIALKEVDLLHGLNCLGLACTRSGNRLLENLLDANLTGTPLAGCSFERISLCPEGHAATYSGEDCLPSLGERI